MTTLVRELNHKSCALWQSLFQTVEGFAHGQRLSVTKRPRRAFHKGNDEYYNKQKCTCQGTNDPQTLFPFKFKKLFNVHLYCCCLRFTKEHYCLCSDAVAVYATVNGMRRQSAMVKSSWRFSMFARATTMRIGSPNWYLLWRRRPTST